MREIMVKCSKTQGGAVDYFALNVPETAEEAGTYYGEERAVDFACSTHIIRFQGEIRKLWVSKTAKEIQKALGPDYMPAARKHADPLLAIRKNAASAAAKHGKTEKEILEAMIAEIDAED
jgi:hypothetical protein